MRSPCCLRASVPPPQRLNCLTGFTRNLIFEFILVLHFKFLTAVNSWILRLAAAWTNGIMFPLGQGFCPSQYAVPLWCLPTPCPKGTWSDTAGTWICCAYPYRVEVKNSWDYTSTLPYVFIRKSCSMPTVSEVRLSSPSSSTARCSAAESTSTESNYRHIRMASNG
jgi:hypothetical protein